MLTENDILIIRLMRFVSDSVHSDISTFLSLRAYHHTLFFKHLKTTPCLDLALSWESSLKRSIRKQLTPTEYEISKLIIPRLSNNFDSPRDNQALLNRAKKHVNNHFIASIIKQIHKAYLDKSVNIEQAEKLALAIVSNSQPCLDGLLEEKIIADLGIKQYAQHSEESIAKFIKAPLKKNISFKPGVMNQLAFSSLLESPRVGRRINSLSSALANAIQAHSRDGEELNSEGIQRNLSLLTNEITQAITHEDLISSDTIADHLRTAHLSAVHLFNEQTSEGSPFLGSPIDEKNMYGISHFSDIAQAALSESIQESSTFLQEAENFLLSEDDNSKKESEESDKLAEKENKDMGILTAKNPSEEHPDIVASFNQAKNRMLLLGVRLFGKGLCSPPEGEKPSDAYVHQELKLIFAHMFAFIKKLLPDTKKSKAVMKMILRPEQGTTPVRNSTEIRRFYCTFVDAHCAPPENLELSNEEKKKRSEDYKTLPKGEREAREQEDVREETKRKERFKQDKTRGLRHDTFKLPNTWPVVLLSSYLSQELHSALISQTPAGHQVSSDNDYAERPSPHMLALWATVFSSLLAKNQFEFQLPVRNRPQASSNIASELNKALTASQRPLSSSQIPAPAQTPAPKKAKSLARILATGSPSPASCPLKRLDISLEQNIEQHKSHAGWKVGIVVAFVLGVLPGIIALAIFLGKLGTWKKRRESCRTLRMNTPNGKTHTKASIVSGLSQLNTPWRKRDLERTLATLEEAPQLPACTPVHDD